MSTVRLAEVRPVVIYVKFEKKSVHLICEKKVMGQ